MPRQLILTISIGLISDFITSQTLDVIPSNSSFKAVCDQIQVLLLLNKLQRSIVESILDFIIKNKGTIYFDIDQQLLIYIKSRGGVRKSRVIKAIKIDFTLLGKRKKLVISALISSLANGIDGSIVYTALRVNNWVKKNY